MALVSGISLRTIQRVENEGKCSFSSKRALASAFDLDAAELSDDTLTISLSKNEQIRQTAISWLKTVDSGEYANSWQEAAPLFQSRISNIEWVKTLTQIRKPLGKVISRSIKNATKHNSLPGVPDGQYIVIAFATSYDRKLSSIETVTLSEMSSEWRVTGYFIK